MSQESKKCEYGLAWQGPCGKELAPGFVYCAEHEGKICEGCGDRATHECDQTMGALICGQPICDECEHWDPTRIDHGRKDAPRYHGTVSSRMQSAEPNIGGMLDSLEESGFRVAEQLHDTVTLEVLPEAQALYARMRASLGLDPRMTCQHAPDWSTTKRSLVPDAIDVTCANCGKIGIFHVPEVQW